MSSKMLRLYSKSFERSPYLTLLCTNALLMGLGDISAQTMHSFNASPELLSQAFDYERTMRYCTYGAAIGPLGGRWFQYLETRFPLRTVIKAEPSVLNQIPTKSRFEELKNPIPGMKLPKGSRLERGSGGKASTNSNMGEKEKVKSGDAGVEGKVSLLALSKRVAADQLGMAPVALFIFLFSMAVLEGLDHDGVREKITSNYLPILLVNWTVWPFLQTINFRYVPLQYRIPFGSICGIAWTAYLSSQTSSTAEAAHQVDAIAS